MGTLGELPGKGRFGCSLKTSEKERAVCLKQQIESVYSSAIRI